jgi:nicotinate-nucleotide adenylyltransferase
MKLGLFGGTFDPVHEGHVAVGRAALREAGLERLLWIPNRLPPHKQAATGASFAQRAEMVELAIAGEAGMELCDIENREGKSYTIQTLKSLRSIYGPSALFSFVIGADAFAEVHLWYQVQEVFAMTEFLVLSRPGFEYPVPEGARVKRLDGLESPYSSTGIRAAIGAGRQAAGLNAAVAGYIKANGLYRNS